MRITTASCRSGRPSARRRKRGRSGTRGRNPGGCAECAAVVRDRCVRDRGSGATADLLGAAGVIVAAVVIMLTGFERADPIASLLIAVLIILRTWNLLRQAGGVLLEATPKGVDLQDVRRHMLEAAGVIDVNYLHAWTITSGVNLLSAHVVVEHETGGGPVPDQLAGCLADHFDIEHFTFQIEPPGHRDHEPILHQCASGSAWPGGDRASMTAAAEASLRQRGLWLEYASVAWMTVEAAVAVTAAVLASSAALAGFGLDSVIEICSAAIVIWQMRGELAGRDRQTRAVRLIALTFFALAAYLTAQEEGVECWEECT
ncbi:MAG: cation diffusion facilitator family transporter [Streptosporangiaceae bacterium]